MSGTARAQNFALPGGFASEFVLTDQMTNNSAGAASISRASLINFNQPFTAHCHSFIYGSGLRGDGLTFVISSDPASVGRGGSDLGYAGQNMNSYAFAIDTFNFIGEPVSLSIRILGADP